MSAPLKAGDLAEVVGGLLGAKSPNLGLIVQVVNCVGEHSKHGRIWACDAEYAERGQQGTRDYAPGLVDFAQDWLRKIEPPPLPAKVKEKELDLLH